MRLVLATSLGLAVAVSGCNRNDKSPTRPSLGLPSAATTTVVQAPWGSADAQLGKTEPDEGAPRGPQSFVVDASGKLYVLDASNSRIAIFSGSQWSQSIAIPEGPFVDLELDGDTGFGLLQIDGTPRVVFVGKDGTESTEVPIVTDQLEEAGALTALARANDGWYVEVEGDYLLRVADAEHAAVEQEPMPGQVVTPDTVFKIDTTGSNQFELIRQTLDQEPELVADVGFSQPLAERTLFAAGNDGSLLVCARLMAAQSDPAKPPTQSHQLVELGSDGHEIKRELLPLPGGALDSFRSVRVGADGNVYVMTFGDQGVEIDEVQP